MPIAGGTIAGGYLTGRALIVPLSLVISLFFLWGFSYGLLDGQCISHDMSGEELPGPLEFLTYVVLFCPL